MPGKSFAAREAVEGAEEAGAVLAEGALAGAPHARPLLTALTVMRSGERPPHLDMHLLMHQRAASRVHRHLCLNPTTAAGALASTIATYCQ